MPEKLLFMARGFAIVVLLFAIALIIARWRFPHNQQKSGSTLAYWREMWRHIRKAKSRNMEREANIKAVRGMLALVVDPDEKSSRVLIWRLESMKCTVVKARNGAQGLSVAKSQKPDFIISDALLPDISAVDFHDSLEMPHVPVVFVGVLAAQREEFATLKNRVECLGKPFDPEDAVALAGKLIRAKGFNHGNTEEQKHGRASR